MKERKDDRPEETPKEDLDSSVGFEFPVNTDEEDDEFIRRQGIKPSPSEEAIAFSTKTIDIDEAGSSQEVDSRQGSSLFEYQEIVDVQVEESPFENVQDEEEVLVTATGMMQDSRSTPELT